MNDITFETFEETDKIKFTKTLFLEQDFGIHQVRLLTQPEKIFVHFFKSRGAIECLGHDCPVCKINKSLQAEDPGNYKQHPLYNGSSPRHYINVLDRTPVKVCSNVECQCENTADLTGQFSAACKKCGTFIGNQPVTISNKVKVANISETNAGRLMALRQAIRDENGEPLGLGNFDLEIVVTKTGGKKDIIVQASNAKNSKDVVNVPEESLYNLKDVTVKLTPTEVTQFLTGISLKDIYAARKAASSSSAEKSANTEIMKTIEERLAQLGS